MYQRSAQLKLTELCLPGVNYLERQLDLLSNEYVHTLFLWFSHCLPKAVNLYFWSRLLGLSGNV